MKLIFMGTPYFAVPSLKKLIEIYEVAAVFTQPDRPKGRGKKLSTSPVKDIAEKFNIPVYQPEKIKNHGESIEAIKKIQPDFIIVVAFGQILPEDVLSIPKYGCINLHASLLPKYRGAAPINWAIINGETKSGNTTMLMDVGLDTGDMLLSSDQLITETMTAGELHDLLMEDGAELLIKTIEGISAGKIVPKKQDNALSNYAPMLSKELAKIDWNKSNIEINNLIKGLNPVPIAYSIYDNMPMKIYEADLLDSNKSMIPGTITDVSKKGIEVSAGKGGLLIKRIQFPGGKPLTVEEYIRGHELKANKVLE